jgi:hypothetical protein
VTPIDRDIGGAIRTGGMIALQRKFQLEIWLIKP